MHHHTHTVIMAGGSGTRFWPYSRDAKPKQFLDIIGTGRSLLQMTFDRFTKITSKNNIWIVTNEKYNELTQEQLPELPKEHILLEPVKRNTAPCIAYAAHKISEKDPHAVMVVTPSDHAVFNESRFEATVGIAIEDASKTDHLLTIGIKPDRPETGYGYIQYAGSSEEKIKKVKTFTEKPQADLAKKFLESGDFLWNSGIFVWSADSIIHAFEQYEEEIASLFASGAGLYFSAKEKDFISNVYSQCKNISIDYAIIEKAENVYVVPGDFSWSDLGSWNALYRIREKDKNGNVIEGSVITYESKNNYIRGHEKRLILTQGMEGYLVADFDDVLLICRKEQASVLKELLADVKVSKGEAYI